jgi:hypothetical protein
MQIRDAETARSHPRAFTTADRTERKRMSMWAIYIRWVCWFFRVLMPLAIYIYIYTGEFGSIKNRKSNEENEKKRAGMGRYGQSRIKLY